MKKLILMLVWSIACTAVFGQDEVDIFISEGITLHDKGDYKGAIEKYDKALKLDKDNLTALAEKAMTLLTMGNYNDAITVCKKAIEKHPGEEPLKQVYVTYGNAYDGLKKPERSVEIYNEGIEQFPGFYQLYFNKGITLTGQQKYEEAIGCFHQSITLNPKHPGSHNAIARIERTRDKMMPSLLAYSRFLVVEPEGTRAGENLEGLKSLMAGNVKKTGKNSITINVKGDLLPDTTADGKKVENNFGSTELLLSISAGLDLDKKKSEVESFLSKFDMVCSSLKETKKDNTGFYWQYYAPYFIEMKEKGLTETFAYIAFASSGDKKVTKWIKAHGEDIGKFYEWSNSYVWVAE